MRALLLLLTACWGTSQSAAPSQPVPSSEPAAPSSSLRARMTHSSCNRTLAQVAEMLRPDVITTGIPDATFDELAEAAIESCHSTDWSWDLLSCLDSTTNPDDLNTCRSLLTEEQSSDLNHRMMEVLARMKVAPPPPSP